jgi:chromosome segregation ATPase
VSDLEEKLRDKLITIQSLNQKIETLQAQLSGAQRRAHELSEEAGRFQELLASKDLEIQTLRADADRYKAALEKVGHEIRDMRTAQAEALSQKHEPPKEARSDEELALLRESVSSLKEDLKTLSQAATAVLNEEPEAVAALREAVLEVGDPQYRVLNLVLTKRSVRLEEIASILVTDTHQAYEIVDALQAAGEVELEDEHTVVPAARYREVKIPSDEWQSSDPPDIFDSLVDVVGRTEGSEGIVEALEIAVDILEQKLSRGGSLVFEMRRTAGSWRSRPGDIEELQYKIRDWKARAL